jgi:DNA-binding SARP family transcriptional activator
MTPLRIRLFGGVQLSRGDAPLPPFPTQRARSLFAYLVLNRARPHARELLIDHLWGEEGSAIGRKGLRMALWRVRAVVDPPQGDGSAPPLSVTTATVGFNGDSDFWLDVEEFESLVQATGSREDVTELEASRLERAVALYRGDLLEEIYDDWCLYDRERLRLLYHSALERLMRFEQVRSDWSAAILRGQQLLALDPLMEPVHRELMRCYLARGSRGAALRQFDDCARILRDELDIAPMPETVELCRTIRGNGKVSPAPEPAPSILVGTETPRGRS